MTTIMKAQLCRPACPGEGQEFDPLQTLDLHLGEPDGDQETKVGRVSARASIGLFKIGLRAFKRSVRPATAVPVSHSRCDPESNPRPRRRLPLRRLRLRALG